MNTVPTGSGSGSGSATLPTTMFSSEDYLFRLPLYAYIYSLCKLFAFILPNVHIFYFPFLFIV
jgi:ABC-type uncharacterized transport system permease subunit